MKRETENPTIFEDFSTSYSIKDRTTMKKIEKGMEDLNYTINQLDLTTSTG